MYGHFLSRSADMSASSIPQLYEDIFGVAAPNDFDHKNFRAFIPNRVDIGERIAWAQRSHGFTWTERMPFNRMQQKSAYESQECDCHSHDPQNAAMMFECLFARGCQNRQLQDLAENPASGPELEIFDTGSCKGYGVRAVCDIQQGSLICEYTGEFLNRAQFARRRQRPGSKSYLMKADTAVIDASRRGNAARFINHSCDPCAEVQVWSVPAASRRSLRTAVGIFACRLIKAGEEITYDYRFEAFDDGGELACECGASLCRGTLGKRKLACTRFTV